MAVHATFAATVEEVYSGDDLVLMVDLGVSGLFRRVRARLAGVDTPSAFRAAPDTEAGSLRQRLRETVTRGTCSVELHTEGKGGWLVTLFVNENGQVLNVNEMLIAEGYVYLPQTGNQ